VTASKENYEPQTKTVEVRPGVTSEVNFSLAENGRLYGVNVSNITSTGAKINFTTRDLCRSYVTFGTSAGYGNQTDQNATPTFNHSFNLTQLIPNTTYHFQCVAVDSASRTLRSGDRTFTTLSAARSNPPQNVSTSRSSGTQGVIISWSADTQADFSGYRVYRSNSPVGGFQLLGTTSTSNEYIDSTLLPGEKGYYYVTRLSGSGEESPPSAIVSFLCPGISRTNLVWSPEQNPIILTGDLIVNQGTSLTILPGTSVKIASVDAFDLSPESDRKVEIKIQGSLFIDGNSSNPVSIT